MSDNVTPKGAISNEERIAALEAELAKAVSELAELKAQLKPKEEFKPKKPWQKIDYTAGFRLPADAAQAMARIVSDVKRPPMTAEQIESAWGRSRISGPSGLGPSSRDRMRAMEEETRRRDREKMEKERAERAAAAPKPGSVGAALAPWRNKPTI